MHETLRVIVASGNPVKHEATRRGLAIVYPDRVLEVEGVSVPSGVSDQPMSDRETLDGARHRVVAAAAQRPEADFWVGLEGGVDEMAGSDDLFAFAWVVVRGPGGREGRSRTAAFQLPPEIAELVRSGVELGEADDRVFARRGSKRRGGAVGLLTEARLDRADLYTPAVVLAAIPFMQPRLFPI